jgi:glucan endo-1,3-alpha-glucosidase
MIPAHFQTDDTAWMIVFAASAATVEAYTTDDSKQSFEVEAGMTRLSFPLKPDGGMKAAMIRREKIVAECNPIGYRFESRPGVYNFNVHVAMSP